MKMPSSTLRLISWWTVIDALRRDVWPEPKPLRVKLYGKQEELRKTATFERATDISFSRTTTKKKKTANTEKGG